MKAMRAAVMMDEDLGHYWPNHTRLIAQSQPSYKRNQFHTESAKLVQKLKKDSRSATMDSVLVMNPFAYQKVCGALYKLT